MAVSGRASSSWAAGLAARADRVLTMTRGELTEDAK